jgi:hypothetical protein
MAGTLTATAFIGQGTNPAFSSSGALTANVKPRFSASPAPSGSGSLTAAVIPQYQVSMAGGAPPVTDDFNRADANDLGAGWTYRAGSGLGIRSGQAVALGASNWCIHSNNTPMPSDDFEVSIILGSTPGGNYAMVGGGFNNAGEGAFLFSSGSAFTIYSQTDWATWTGYGSPAVTTTTGDKIALRRTGNTYYGLLNDVLVPGSIWTDSSNLVPRDASHRLVDIGCYYDGPAPGRAIDSFSAVGVGGGGGLTGVGNLAAALKQIYTTVPGGLVGLGSLSSAVKQIYPITTDNTGGSLLDGAGTLSATAINAFTPITEENQPRTNVAIPANASQVRVTLIGAGGGGGAGVIDSGSSNNKYGGKGGGGGAYLQTPWIPKANLGSTYSVVVPGTAAAGAAGAAATFVSGATSLSAGGGAAGAAGSSSATRTAGGSPTGFPGGSTTEAGGTGGYSTGTLANEHGTGTTDAGCGGGAGGYANSAGGGATAGGNGGSSTGPPASTGGTGGAPYPSGAPGNPGPAPIAGQGGGGGGGGGVTGASGNGQRSGGNGTGYGAGGGGSGGAYYAASATAGTGGPGYTLVEWQ